MEFETRNEAKNYFISNYILKGNLDLKKYLNKKEENVEIKENYIQWNDSFERFDINKHKEHFNFLYHNRKIELHRIKNTKIFIDNYTNRIVFPIYENNKLIFYTKRSIIPSEYSWIKSKGDEVYPIWNFDNIYYECYTFEGILDAIHLKKGIALLGANLQESIEKLGSKKCKIYNIIMDNDEAGLRAKIKIANILKYDFNAQVNIYNYKNINCKDFGEMKIKGINFQLKERLYPYDLKTQLLIKRGYII
jgi:DNA primase